MNNIINILRLVLVFYFYSFASLFASSSGIRSPFIKNIINKPIKEKKESPVNNLKDTPKIIEVEQPQHKFKLTAIVDNFAIIDSQLVKVGSNIGGFSVIEIFDKSVILSNTIKTLTLNIDADI